MASFSAFIRKSPPQSLRRFLEIRGVATPDDFVWDSETRGTKWVQSVNGLISELPDWKQDRLKAELDLLASLSDNDGMVSAEELCAGQGIDIEGLEGVEDVLLMLATDHEQTILRVSAQASLKRRSGGKQWSAFQFDDDGKSWCLDDTDAQDAFLADVIEILNLPAHRQRDADWYKSIRVDPFDGSESEITHATIYVEDRAASELAFKAGAGLQRHLVQKVLEVGMACDAKARMVEICVKGGKKVRDECAETFARHFAPNSEPPVETPRRNVFLDTLKSAPYFETEPADGIGRIEVSSLEFFSSDGGFVRIEKRGPEETIYEFAQRRFATFSPLRAPGWRLVGATLRIFVAATDMQSKQTLTVTLRTPNTTSLPNKTEKDRKFVFDLLERWDLLAPRRDDPDATVIEQ